MPYSTKLRSKEEARAIKTAREKQRLERLRAERKKLEEEYRPQLEAEKEQKRLFQREKKRQSDATYKAQRREKLKQQAREYYSNLSPERKERLTEARRKSGYNRKYYEENKDRLRKRSSSWGKANPEKVRVNCQNRRARKKQNGGKLSGDIAQRLIKLQKGRCAICKTKIEAKKYHLDHITPLSSGGANVDANIQLLCPPCNISKYNHHPIDYMQKRGYLL